MFAQGITEEVSRNLAAEDAFVIVAAHDFGFVDWRHRLTFFGGSASFAAAFNEDMPL